MDRTPRIISRPQPGYWAVRLGGVGTPEVGAAIIRRVRRPPDPASPTNVQTECNVLEAYIDGRLVGVEDVWTRKGRPITEAEYRWMVEDRAWCRQWAPHSPEANPRVRVDLRAVAPVLPPKGRS